MTMELLIEKNPTQQTVEQNLYVLKEKKRKLCTEYTQPKSFKNKGQINIFQEMQMLK